jgi:hypothetical protein
MQNWGYKATSTKLDKHGTLLLLERGFLSRSMHDAGGHAAANVSAVRLGDVLHCYFARSITSGARRFPHRTGSGTWHHSRLPLYECGPPHALLDR